MTSQLQNWTGKKRKPRTVWEKLREKDTRKAAIDAKCYECMGWQEGGDPDPGIRENIRSCTATKCPLHSWRPAQ